MRRALTSLPQVIATTAVRNQVNLHCESGSIHCGAAPTSPDDRIRFWIQLQKVITSEIGR
jgi:hypothetical protein